MTKYSYIFLFLIVILAVTTTGCTVSESHERYTEVTIIDKFYKSEPMLGANLLQVPNGMAYSYDYYIRYNTNGNVRIDRVSKEVYGSVFITHTYILKWGYINDFNCIEKTYGYVSIISEVYGEQHE